MSGTQQYGAYGSGAQSSGAQLDPQGLLGSLLGGLAGGVLGKAVGGSTGRTVGGIAGKVLGGFLPFDAGQPTMPSASSNQPPSQLEMQGFMDVIRKVTSGLRTGLDIGRQLGVFSADQPGQQQPISEIEAQCFSRVIDWIARSDPQRTQAYQQGSQTAGIAPLSAGQPGQGGQAGQGGQQVSQIELQGFWDVLRKVAGGVQTGLNIGHNIGLFEAGQPSQGQGGQAGQGGQQVSQVELQGFWDVLRKVAGGVQTGLNVGHNLGLFEAGQGGRPQGAMQGGGIAPEQVQALLQQALPALQAMAQQQQGYTRH